MDRLLARQWEPTQRPPFGAGAATTLRRDAITMSTLTARLTYRTRAPRAAAMHAARAFAALAGALVLIAVLASTVFGASPKRLTTQVTDDVGALGGSTGTVQKALDDLQSTASVQLWVWFTDTTGGLSAADFAKQTATTLNGFGGNDLLLVIAMTDHAYGYWKSDSIPLSNAQLDSVLGADLERPLKAGDNGGAIVATAAGIRGAMGGSTGGSPLGTLVTVLLVVGVIAVAGWWFLYRRKRTAVNAAGGVHGGALPAVEEPPPGHRDHPDDQQDGHERAERRAAGRAAHRASDTRGRSDDGSAVVARLQGPLQVRAQHRVQLGVRERDRIRLPVAIGVVGHGDDKQEVVAAEPVERGGGLLREVGCGEAPGRVGEPDPELDARRALEVVERLLHRPGGAAQGPDVVSDLRRETLRACAENGGGQHRDQHERAGERCKGAHRVHRRRARCARPVGQASGERRHRDGIPSWS